MSLNLHLSTEDRDNFDLFQTPTQVSRDICGTEGDDREHILARYANWLRTIPNLQEHTAEQHLCSLREFIENYPTAYFYIM